MTIVPNDGDELVAQRTVVGYRMCIDFRKLNKETRKWRNLKCRSISEQLGETYFLE